MRSLHRKTVIQGSGAKLTSADGMIANYVAYDWSGKTSKLLGSSYTQGAPSIVRRVATPGLEDGARSGRSSAAGCSR